MQMLQFKNALYVRVCEEKITTKKCVYITYMNTQDACVQSVRVAPVKALPTSSYSYESKHSNISLLCHE